MKNVIMLLLLLLPFCSQAKKVKGYYVTQSDDTTYVTFKAPYRISGLNLMKISGVLSYFLDNNDTLYRLYPADVKFVKIFRKDEDDYDIVPFNGMFVQRTIKGALSCYKTDYKGEVQSVEFGSVRTRISVYYLELKNGERRSFEIQGSYWILHKDFWIYFLGKDYPEFIECLSWDWRIRKERKKSGLDFDCDIKNMNFDEVIHLFNKKYN